MYYVYILASRSRNLYIGVTGNLDRRIFEHKQKLVRGFSSRYNIDRLLYFEMHGDVRRAIAREKELKGWRREKKITLIEQREPHMGRPERGNRKNSRSFAPLRMTP